MAAKYGRNIGAATPDFVAMAGQGDRHDRCVR